jgi:oligopeptide/dipeptide ABC transporter ATP-binding protein
MTNGPMELAPTVNEPAPPAGGGENVLSVEDLWVELRLRKRTVHPLNGVTLSVMRRETLGLVGESGSGKSMLALAVMGLLPQPFSKIVGGRVQLGDIDALALKEKAMRRVRGARVSMVFQEPMTALDPLFTVGDQIAEAVRAHRDVSRAEAREAAVAMLERVGIASAARRVDSYPHELSGGMRQRVVIAIALCLQPAVLLADEPTTALDVTVQAQILDLIRELQAEMNMGVVLITHDLAVVAEVAHRVAVMYAGLIVETAPTPELFSHPQHPYTAGLMRSTLAVDTAGERLHVIPGRPPDLSRPLSGCPFAPRCERATDRCSTEMPPETQRPGDPRHAFRCWHPIGG